MSKKTGFASSPVALALAALKCRLLCTAQRQRSPRRRHMTLQSTPSRRQTAAADGFMDTAPADRVCLAAGSTADCQRGRRKLAAARASRTDPRLEPPAPIRCAQFPQNAISTLTVIAEKRG